MSAGAVVPGSWRRHSTKEFTVLAVLITLTVLLVHRTTLSRENADLAMERVLGELEAGCVASADDNPLDGTIPRLPPAFYGLGVWVDSPALLPGVHATLSLMKERLSGDAAASAASPPPTHSLHSFVRLQTRARDAAVNEVVQAAQKQRSGNVSEKHVSRKLERLASQQQLGMPTMKHAFLPEVGQEVELHGLSLFSVPAEVLPAGARVQCFIADARQAYCVFPIASQTVEEVEEGEEEAAATADGQEDGGEELDAQKSAARERRKTTRIVTAASSITAAAYQTHAASLEDEIRAAMLSVMTKQMHLRSFKSPDVTAWKQSRERQGCVYTIASVRSTLRSIEANTNMVIPLSTEHMFADLENHVRAKAFVRAARAADDLQFHPSLTPQLYIPWDHSVVSQLVILLPMVSTTLLAVRFMLDERRSTRARAAKAVKDAKKDQ